MNATFFALGPSFAPLGIPTSGYGLTITVTIRHLTHHVRREPAGGEAEHVHRATEQLSQNLKSSGSV